MPILWSWLLLDAQAVVGVLWLRVGSDIHHDLSNVHAYKVGSSCYLWLARLYVPDGCKGLDYLDCEDQKQVA